MIIKFTDYLLEYWSNNDKIRQIKIDETIHVYEDDDLLVVIPKTLDSACLYGKNTKWCFASKEDQKMIKTGRMTDDESMFAEYIDSDVIYIFILKKTNKKYTFRFETGDFESETGERYNFSEFLEDYPKLKELLENHIKNGTYTKYPYPHIHLDVLNQKQIKKSRDPFYDFPGIGELREI